MKHIRRALKYFIQVVLIFTVIIGALMLLGLVSSDVNVAFRNGWRSIGYIAGVFFVVSLVYPFFGYTTRTIRAKGEIEDIRKAVEESMKQRGYVFESEGPDGSLKYRLASPAARAFRLWEDTVTITPSLGVLQAEGLTRDLARVAMSIDHNINSYE